jgi:REP element-mobilizing transposase RayT
MLLMSEQPAKRLPCPPRNPGLRDLIYSKRKWSSTSTTADARRGFRGWHERGYLPHRDEPGLTQFVTFHLADSFPAALRSEWEYLWRIEEERERRTQLERYLDAGKGECLLRKPELAQLVADNLLDHAIGRCELRAWVVMPNHVHVLFKVGVVPMSEIVGNWKKHTGRLAHKGLGRRGAFWAEDYFDMFMRDADHEQRTTRYIENNPTRAKLVRDPRDWLWSSARHRDPMGTLRLTGSSPTK